jgi:thiamine-phosphate pyrophosphorylase
VSVSCHSLEEAKAARGADMIILGTIFETDCKKGLKGKGLDFLREVCAAVSVPVYAIGGITPHRLPEIKKAGAAGGCMMSYFMRI